MRLFLSALIVCLLLINHCCEGKKKKHHKGCEGIVHQLSAANANFIQCAINNAVPVNMCLQCIGEFEGLSNKWSNLTSNETCKDIYFNKDRLNIVEHMYLNAKALWEKAYCSECSNANETNLILEAIHKVDDCIDINHSVACSNCKKDYEAANSEYTILSDKYSGKICFDIQDEMNRTRITWSKDLKCCKRTANLHTFAAISSVFSILPILFYLGLVIYTKRRESNQQILYADLENVNRGNPSGRVCGNSNEAVTGENVDEPQPSTSFEASNVNQLCSPSQDIKDKKTVNGNEHDDDDNDDDDDELVSLGTASYNPLNRQSSQLSLDSEIKKKIS